jgi:HSP20 family protein
MKIIRYQMPVLSPAASFFGLREEMDRLFDVAFLPNHQVREFPVDLYETDDSYVFRAELPGFRKEDLSLEIAEGQLNVSAHQKLAEGSTEKNGIQQERRFGRSISLPDKVRADAIQAHYENGVLTVTLPRQEEVKPRQIAIEVK